MPAPLITNLKEKSYRVQQFQIQNLMVLKALRQRGLTMFDNLSDR